MRDRVGPAEGIRCQDAETVSTWRLMLQGYRRSYGKTVLAAGAATLVCATLAIAWIAKAEIWAPGLALSREDSPLTFWALVIMVTGCALAAATVASGGAICLYREWKQYR